MRAGAPDASPLPHLLSPTKDLRYEGRLPPLGMRLSGGMSERIRTHLEVGKTHARGPGIKNFKCHSAEQEILEAQKSLVEEGGISVT